MAQVLTIATSKDNNDIYLDGNNNIVVAEDKDALSNVIRNVVLTDRGELQFNLNYGIPYFSTIFSSGANLPMWKYYVIDAVSSLDFISGVVNMDYNVSDGVLSYSITVQSNIGNFTVNG